MVIGRNSAVTLIFANVLMVSGCSLPNYDLMVENHNPFAVSVTYGYVNYQGKTVNLVLGAVPGNSTSTFRKVLFRRARAYHLRISDQQGRVVSDSNTPAEVVNNQLVNDTWTLRVPGER
jgi:hypothetical protein